MIKASLLAFVAAAAIYAAPIRLRCEYLDNPLGIDASAPHLSWQNDATERNWKQSAYQIRVATTPGKLRTKPDVWDSGRKEGAASVDVPYGGPALHSGTRYYWTVKVWDRNGRTSVAAAPAWWETGLLAKSDWHATWIARKDEEAEDRKNIRLLPIPGLPAAQAQPAPPAVRPAAGAQAAPAQPGPSYRLLVQVKQLPVAAALFVAIGGGWTAKVNGSVVTKKSAWGSFDRQNILGNIKSGENEIEISLPAPRPGRARQGRGPDPSPNLAALLKLVYRDGSVERYPSGPSWQSRLTPDAAWGPATVGDLLGENRKGSSQGNLPQPASLLRKEFEVSKRVLSARVYVTALGSYQLYLNGKKVGNDFLTPEFTEYSKRVIYQTYDVTGMLANGRNAIGAILGDGWFLSGLVTWGSRQLWLPAPPRLLAEMRIQYTDGSSDTIATGPGWKAAQSPILHSEIYAGETYDARLEQPGWDNVRFDDSAWAPAIPAEGTPGAITAQMAAPVRILQTLKPETVKAQPNGAYVFDMGQNMVGWVALKANGPVGTRVRVRYAEILNPDGSIYTANLREADSTNTYILRGGGEETLRPHFTFHGFRYVEVTGYPGVPTTQALTGEVLTSVGPEPTATIRTSSDLVNRFWKTGLWGQRGNFLSVPTDCPQRDERLGWTGDAEVFWRTGAYNFDTAAFGRQWMRTLVDSQLPDGTFPNTAPNTLLETSGTAGWGDAGVIIPWTAWLQYGDKSIVQENWDAMQRWMDLTEKTSPDYLRRGGLGDWLPAGENTNSALVAEAYWILIADQMAQMAKAIGKDADAARYAATADKVRAAFRKQYVKDDGTVGTGTQTGYVLALYTKAVEPALIPKLIENLVKNIEGRQWHLATGFLGTPYLLTVLSENGHTDVAYRLLLTETYPSWGYMLSKGATTWWERWNGDTGDPAMNSYNHYAFGSVVSWIYRNVTGIDTTVFGPGFQDIVIRPRLDPSMTRAAGEYQSVYGKIATEWATSAGRFTLQVTIPANTEAKVYLPANVGKGRVTEGGKPLQPQRDGADYVLPLGSGTYRFEVY